LRASPFLSFHVQRGVVEFHFEQLCDVPQQPPVEGFISSTTRFIRITFGSKLDDFFSTSSTLCVLTAIALIFTELIPARNEFYMKLRPAQQFFKKS